jgi:thiamine biosynthesis protein ThiS
MSNQDVQSQLIEIVVNGELRRVAPELTIDRLLEHLDLPSDRLAVELDKRIISKRDWPATRINAGATLEIVQFVGGG